MGERVKRSFNPEPEATAREASNPEPKATAHETFNPEATARTTVDAEHGCACGYALNE